MTRSNGPAPSTLLALTLSLVFVMTTAAHATTITINNLDGGSEGFNDTTVRSPEGGNPGTTLGALRLNAFNEAANRWEAVLSSSVVIVADSNFDPLTPCGGGGALLGFAGPNTIHRDFVGAPVASTWFGQAEANSLNGSDLAPGTADLAATFNSDIDNGCLPGITGWYYGFDGNPPSGKIDFVPVLLHEMAHGLGFLTFVDLASGAKIGGFNDIFMTFLENHSTTLMYPAMSDAQRVTASTNTGNLHWVGANVATASSLLSAGKVGTHVRMYAPNPQEPGSSVSHWDTALTPNEVMEPIDTGSNFRSLTLAAFDDMQWTVLPEATPTPSLTPTPTLTATRTATATPTRTLTATPTPTITATPTLSPTATVTESPTPTLTATSTPIPTATATGVPTPVCGATPQGGCMTPAVTQKALLQFKDKTPDDKDLLQWKFLKGPAMVPGDFGNPITTDTYELCIYDGSSNLISHATAPAGGLCNISNPRPCWSANSKGFKYVDKDLTPLGVQKIILKASPTAGGSKILVKGKGVNIDMPPIFPLVQPITVQLLNSSNALCWEATYLPPALKNTVGPPGEFKDKAD